MSVNTNIDHEMFGTLNDNDYEKNDNDSDETECIIKDIGGSYGRFQILNYFIYMIAFCFCGIVALNYVFTSLNLDYR